MPPWPPDLEECWDKVKATKELLKKMLADVLDENPELLAKTQPVFGVTDGSNALPGTVGEFVELHAPDIAFPTATTTSTAIAGILPAGDWAVQAYAYVSGAVTGAQFYLDPQPPGVSDSMGAVLALSGQENITLVGPMVRASLSAATVLTFSATTNNEGPGAAPGTMSVRVNAWRVR